MNRELALNPHLIRWLASGSRGLSSESMVEFLTGLECHKSHWRGGAPHHPHDPDDLSRCRKLLREVPLLAFEFPDMALASPEWAALVGAWDELCALMDAEAPEWGNGRGSAPRTYKRMRELLDGAHAKPEGQPVIDVAEAAR